MRAELPAGSEVVVGDQVMLPGVWGSVAATVSAIDAHQGESFIVMYMHLPVNQSELRFVEVLTQ
jgi:hypothetical protein